MRAVVAAEGLQAREESDRFALKKERIHHFWCEEGSRAGTTRSREALVRDGGWTQWEAL